jgi:hypothetical protein
MQMTSISEKVLKNPDEFDWDAATVVDPNTNDARPFSNPVLGREEALSLLSQKIAPSPWVEESFSDALSRAHTIVRDSNLHRRD